MKTYAITTSLSLAATMVAQLTLGLPPSSPTLQLKIDLEVTEMSLKEARLILLKQHDGALLIKDISKTVELSLQFQTAYLIEFQRPGCTSRQLMLDTHIPEADLMNGSVVFHANMKLEMPPKGQYIKFLGPVGYIFYDPAQKTFRYHRDYKMFGEEAMIVQMDAERTRFADPDVPVILPKRGYVAYPGYEYGDHVPTVSTSQPMIHLTGVRRTSASHAMAQEFEIIPEGVATEMVPVTSIVRASLVPDQRISSELSVSSSRIIKDVHVTSNGRTTNYRKVTHHFGAVFFFKDGISCSEHIYLDGTSLSSPTSQVR